MSKTPNPVQQAHAVQLHLMTKGLGLDRLAAIGTYVVAYGLLETNLERTLWALTETDVSGERPFTEKLKMEEWFGLLAKGSPKLSPEANEVLRVAAKAAEDLADYRNSLMHGSLLIWGEGAASFIRNPAWHGEVRNKRTGDANIEEPMLELAIVAAWTVLAVVSLAQKVLGQLESEAALIAKRSEVLRAKSYANEARHIAYLYDNEKY